MCVSVYSIAQHADNDNDDDVDARVMQPIRAVLAILFILLTTRGRAHLLRCMICGPTNAVPIRSSTREPPAHRTARSTHARTHAVNFNYVLPSAHKRTITQILFCSCALCGSALCDSLCSATNSNYLLAVCSAHWHARTHAGTHVCTHAPAQVKYEEYAHGVRDWARECNNIRRLRARR